MTKEKPKEITIDPETNLPELPEGYWWEVTHDTSGSYNNHVRVSIMYVGDKPHWFTGNPTGKKVNKEYEYRLMWWSDFAGAGSPEDQILYLAEKAYKEAVPRWRAESRKERLENLLGKYPPKRLDLPL